MAAAMLLLIDSTHAQAPQWDANGLGRTFLAPNTGNMAMPYNVTIGLNPADFATLRVRGDDLPVPDEFALGRCTFRTDVLQTTTQCWRMMRDINDIGVLWNENDDVAFHVQCGMPRDVGQDRYAGLLLQNHVGDGLWVMHNGGPTGSRAFPNSSQTLNAIGFAALGPDQTYIDDMGTRPEGPWSRFHLFHDVMGDNPAWFAHRPQMRNGITLTGNSDHAYLGQWYDQGTDGGEAEVDDNSNLVIATSEDDIPSGLTHPWDNISFRHFGDLDQVDDGPVNTVEGLEMMRIQPGRLTDEAKVEGMVGIGDFLSAGAVPDERLHLLDKTIRLQDFGTPGLYHDDSFNRVLVVDPADGRVHWRDASTLGGGGSACEWTLQGPPGSNSHISTAYPGNPGCSLMDKAVAIGRQIPKTKLDVNHTDFTNLVRTGIHSQIETQTSGPYVFRAIHGEATPQLFDELCTSTSVGVEGFSRNARQTLGVKGSVLMNQGDPGAVALVGVQGLAQVSEIHQAALVNGVWGWATVDSQSNSTFTAGVVGGVSAPANVPNPWAGYFFGNVHATGTVTWTSDQNLKTNIAQLNGATETIAALQPKRYEYRTGEYPQLNLPSGEHMGLIAQDVQGVLPELVIPANSPEILDSLGNVVSPGVEYLSLNYAELIPLLIAGNQELVGRVNSLEQQVTACCAAGGERAMSPDANSNATALETDLRILPNPVADRTELRYTVGEEGRVRLEITDASGRMVQVQDEGMRASGTFSYGWGTTLLAPGTYYCTLYVNDEPLVKKAVKLNAC